MELIGFKDGTGHKKDEEKDRKGKKKGLYLQYLCLLSNSSHIKDAKINSVNPVFYLEKYCILRSDPCGDSVAIFTLLDIFLENDYLKN